MIKKLNAELLRYFCQNPLIFEQSIRRVITPMLIKKIPAMVAVRPQSNIFPAAIRPVPVRITTSCKMCFIISSVEEGYDEKIKSVNSKMKRKAKMLFEFRRHCVKIKPLRILRERFKD
jgi:hypothetical protein